ncbi:hypothetical protein BDU57DRAFT_579124 [Ampelomyces quisqualis]|uniref:Uncharacterized protein n=1 Tax=Ampelomyces quisqualis TaxID=50730 RepID=A0A6A5QGL4_AMPQU|nr:hypothetical protein BDU57DRAFT_579124 [Ampelomyces quisqualis]
MLHYMVSLSPLEGKTKALLTIIFLIHLILMIHNRHEVQIARIRIQAQTDQRGDSSGLVDKTKYPGLLVFELDKVFVGADDLVGFVDREGEDLGQCKLLACYF